MDQIHQLAERDSLVFEIAQSANGIQRVQKAGKVAVAALLTRFYSRVLYDGLPVR
jgi:hypothetical protein